jgi:hypothetical protein
MAHQQHPATGKSVRTETVCERNPPTYDHETQLVSESWAEIIDRCIHCGMEFVYTVG